ALSWPHLTPLVAAWVCFGLFMIVCSALISLLAERLAHRRGQVVLTEFYEHVLQLPLSFHGSTHSGRLMKVMLTGTDTLWALWRGFFREDLRAPTRCGRFGLPSSVRTSPRSCRSSSCCRCRFTSIGGSAYC